MDSTIIFHLQDELNALEQSIINLETIKYTKESMIEDLKLLLNRISQETCFTNLKYDYSLGIGKKLIHQGKEELPYISNTYTQAPRKFSDETDISELSKCISTSTKAHSRYHEEDDLICDYSDNIHYNRKVNPFYSHVKEEDFLSNLFNFWEVNINIPIRDCKERASK